MKTARKIIVIIAAAMLCLAAAFAMTGCDQGGNSGKQAAIDAYKQASANTVGEKDMSISANYEFDMNIMGQSVTADGSFDFAYELPGKKGSPLDTKILTDFDMNLDMPAAAGVEDVDMEFGAYLTDRTLYLNINVPDSEPAKMGVTLEDSEMKELETMFESVGDLDLGDLKSSDPFPIDDYVINGSFQNGKLDLDIDIMGYTKYILSESAKLGGNDSTKKALEAFEMVEGAIKDVKCHLTADITDDLVFKNMKITLDMTIDAAKLSGESSSVSMDMDISATIDVDTINIDTGKSIKFPSFKDYKVEKVKAEDIASTFAQMAG